MLFEATFSGRSQGRKKAPPLFRSTFLRCAHTHTHTPTLLSVASWGAGHPVVPDLDEIQPEIKTSTRNDPKLNHRRAAGDVLKTPGYCMAATSLSVGDTTFLVTSEVDATDAAGDLVELKSSKHGQAAVLQNRALWVGWFRSPFETETCPDE